MSVTLRTNFWLSKCGVLPFFFCLKAYHDLKCSYFSYVSGPFSSTKAVKSTKICRNDEILNPFKSQCKDTRLTMIFPFEKSSTDTTELTKTLLAIFKSLRIEWDIHVLFFSKTLLFWKCCTLNACILKTKAKFKTLEQRFSVRPGHDKVVCQVSTRCSSSKLFMR